MITQLKSGLLKQIAVKLVQNRVAQKLLIIKTWFNMLIIDSNLIEDSPKHGFGSCRSVRIFCIGTEAYIWKMGKFGATVFLTELVLFNCISLL